MQMFTCILMKKKPQNKLRFFQDKVFDFINRAGNMFINQVKI